MSLLSMDADHAIAALVEVALPRFSGEDGRALYIRLDCRQSNYSCYVEVGTGKKKPCSREDGPSEEIRKQVEAWPVESSLQLHMLFFRPNNYTQVYTAVTDSWDMPGIEDWTLRSDHDSCWNSDGMTDMNRVAQKLHEAVCCEGDTYKDTSDFCWIHTKRVTLKTERTREMSGPNRRRVMSVERGWPDGTEEHV